MRLPTKEAMELGAQEWLTKELTRKTPYALVSMRELVMEKTLWQRRVKSAVTPCGEMENALESRVEMARETVSRKEPTHDSLQ